LKESKHIGHSDILLEVAISLHVYRQCTPIMQYVSI